MSEVDAVDGEKSRAAVLPAFSNPALFLGKTAPCQIFILNLHGLVTEFPIKFLLETHYKFKQKRQETWKVLSRKSIIDKK